MIQRTVACLLVFLSSVQPLSQSPPVPVVKKVMRVSHPEPKAQQGCQWYRGQVTTYAKCFEGRRMACGRIFRHSGHDIACRGGIIGRKIEIRYGKNGRSICVISDRGGLPLHKPNCWQFDVSKRVARDLGLYRVHRGKTDRTIRWRYIK